MTNARTQTSPQNNPQPQQQALVPLETTQQAQALVPASLEAAMQFSQWLAQSSLLPKSVNKEHDIFFIVCAGMELGFAPMAALRSLYVVNGRTALEAKAKAALCRQRGAALYFKKVEDTDKAVAWETHRKGDPSPSVQRFTIDDAKQAGLLGKGGPWTNYPRRMMSWKALGFLCDDTYPDIMLGVATKEDFDEEQIEFRPIATVGAGVELGTIPPKAPANTQQQQQPAAASSTPATPAQPVEQPMAQWDEDDIIEAITRIGNAGSHVDLKTIRKEIWARGPMTEAVRARFAKAYEDQFTMIEHAAREEAAAGSGQ
jgi:hypothetical protein